jgi:hypothetical protein
MFAATRNKPMKIALASQGQEALLWQEIDYGFFVGLKQSCDIGQGTPASPIPEH